MGPAVLVRYKFCTTAQKGPWGSDNSCASTVQLTEWDRLPEAPPMHLFPQLPPQSTPSSLPLCTPSVHDASAPGAKMQRPTAARYPFPQLSQAAPLYPRLHTQYDDWVPRQCPWPLHTICMVHTQPSQVIANS
jgi:hypothetical protein